MASGRVYVGTCVEVSRSDGSFDWSCLVAGKPLLYCSLGTYSHVYRHGRRLLDAVLDALHTRSDMQAVVQALPAEADRDSHGRLPSHPEVHAMSEIDPKALFRLSVLGPLVSREQLARGELHEQPHELAQREYAIPDSTRSRVAEKTIQAWYYAWQRQGKATWSGAFVAASADCWAARVAWAMAAPTVSTYGSRNKWSCFPGTGHTWI